MAWCSFPQAHSLARLSLQRIPRHLSEPVLFSLRSKPWNPDPK